MTYVTGYNDVSFMLQAKSKVLQAKPVVAKPHKLLATHMVGVQRCNLAELDDW